MTPVGEGASRPKLGTRTSVVVWRENGRCYLRGFGRGKRGFWSPDGVGADRRAHAPASVSLPGPVRGA